MRASSAGTKFNSYPLASASSRGSSDGGKQADSCSDSDSDSGPHRPMTLNEASRLGALSGSDNDSDGGSKPHKRVREKSSFIGVKSNSMITDGVALHGVWLGAYLGDLGMLQDACAEDSEMIHKPLRRADNKTPIMLAAQVGALDCVEWLLSQGASTSAQDVFGRSALMLASKYNFPEVVKCLLRHDRSLLNHLSENNLDALMYAVEEGSLEAVQVLMDYSPNMDTMATGGEHFGRTVIAIGRARESDNRRGSDVLRALHGEQITPGMGSRSVSQAARRAARRRISGTAASILKEAMNFNGRTEHRGGSRK